MTLFLGLIVLTLTVIKFSIGLSSFFLKLCEIFLTISFSVKIPNSFLFSNISACCSQNSDSTFFYKKLGIANTIIINEAGLSHPIYKGKDKKFNAPAFNFDEVVKMPDNSICLASNNVNKIQSLYFTIGKTKVWGLQYHPEITYEKMIRLIEFRKQRLIENRKVFENESDVNKHISFIKKEILVSNRENRMVELKNWLSQLN